MDADRALHLSAQSSCDFDLSSEREANHTSKIPKNCQKMWTESKDARPENILINPPTGSQPT